MNEIKDLIARSNGDEAVEIWNIFAALGDADMFYALQEAGYRLANAEDIDPDTITKEELLDKADEFNANMIVINVGKNFSSDEASKYFYNAENHDNRNIFVFSIQNSFTRSIYEQTWDTGRIATGVTPDDLAYFVGVCMGAISPDARRPQHQPESRGRNSAPADDAGYGIQKSYAPQEEYNENEDAQDYCRENVGDEDEYEDDPYSDDAIPESDSGGIMGFINRLIKNDEGKISIRGWIVMGALVVLILLLFIPSGKKKDEDEPTSVAETTQDPAITEAPIEEEPGEEDIYEEDYPSNEEESEADSESFDEDYSTGDEEFEPVSADPIAQAQERYNELLAAFAAADTSNVEMHMCDNFAIGIVGCAATYDVNNIDIAVAAYKVENTGSEAISFYDDMYACAAQDGKPLIIDTAYLQGEAAAGATTPIQPGQTAIVYQAYQMANDTSQLIVTVESWDAEETPQEHPYQIAG